ncbi:MAG: GAF domain-containing protein, partial [Halanaerobiaceae bacterium]
MGDGLIKVGLEAATYLTNNSEKPLVYEKLMRLIFEKINEFIDVTQISIYVIDNNKKNLKEEAIYHKSGWIPGYDFIKAEDISPTLKEKRVKKFSENNYYKLQVPLHTGSQLLGLLEFRTLSPLSEKYINEIKDIASTISLGLRSVLFEADTIREEKNIQFFIDINNKLQAIDDIDELVNTFLEMTINYYKFDRITVFIFDNDNKILFAEGINEQGKKYNIDKFPLLPDVSEGKIFVDDINNYWIPLKTNTGRVGMVLFDNIYTLYNIPESLLNTLRILTSQFAKAIDNIRMFSSLQESAYYDSLTGLYSRTYLDEIIPEYDKEENIPL